MIIEKKKKKMSIYFALTKLSVFFARMSDGPVGVQIKGDNQATMGQAVQINCSVDSFPVPTFVWKFNGTVLLGETKQCYVIQSFEDKNSGIYTCEAFNNVTGVKNTASFNLGVKGKDHAPVYIVIIH